MKDFLGTKLGHGDLVICTTHNKARKGKVVGFTQDRVRIVLEGSACNELWGDARVKPDRLIRVSEKKIQEVETGNGSKITRVFFLACPEGDDWGGLAPKMVPQFDQDA